MAIFWIAVAALIALALWFAVAPLRRQHCASTRPRSREAILSVFKERLAELESDLRRGVLNEMDFGVAREELDREFLRTTDGVAPSYDHHTDNVPRWPATVATVLIPLLSVSLYLVLGGGPRALQAGPIDTPAKESSPAHADGTTNLSIEEATKRLAARLQREPNDADGWLLLAKSYDFLGRAPEAADAMAHFRALGNNSSLSGSGPSTTSDAINTSSPPVMPPTIGLQGTQSVPDSAAVSAIIDGRNNAAQSVTSAAASITTESDPAIAALEQKLAAHPDDVEGWTMLGRSYQVLRRYTDAAHAFLEAMKHQVGDAALIADYADALAAANGGWVAGEPATWIDKALAIEPRQPKALWLAATAAGQRGDHARALQLWTQLQPLVDPDSTDAQTIAANIDETKRALSGVDTALEKHGEESAANGNSAPAREANTPAAGTRIHGRVALDPSLATSTSAGDTVFIFARAAQGPRMPLAVLRKQVSDLPVEFELDDSMGMTPSLRLSDYNEVVVSARVSKTGDAMAQPGDLEGVSNVIHPSDSQAVNIVINKRS